MSRTIRPPGEFDARKEFSGVHSIHMLSETDNILPGESDRMLVTFPWIAGNSLDEEIPPSLASLINQYVDRKVSERLREIRALLEVR